MFNTCLHIIVADYFVYNKIITAICYKTDVFKYSTFYFAFYKADAPDVHISSSHSRISLNSECSWVGAF